MLDDGLRTIAQAQVEWGRRYARRDPPELRALLSEATTPGEVWHALLRERPVLDRARRWEVDAPDPSRMREEALAAGVLPGTLDDLTYRRLFPSLDLGVYCASHAIGKPSAALAMALEEHLHAGAVHGIAAFESGGWLSVIQRFTDRVRTLVGDPGELGDVAAYPNFSESLGALLPSCAGRLVTTEDHFTSAHYQHEVWARHPKCSVVRVPTEADGTTRLDRLLDALTRDTAVVSLSHAAYRTGFLYDLGAVATAMADRCPNAALLLDVYQTLGTVPVDVTRLPARTAVLGGGVKQLHAGLGTGFGWISHALLEDIVPDRLGWWSHAEPLAFDHGPLRLAPAAGKLRTGTPALTGMLALVTELDVLACCGGGDLRRAVERARAHTREQMAAVVQAATEAGLDVRGGVDPERRAAFVALHVADGATTVARLAADGVVVDFRADVAGAPAGVIRLSANGAGFGYETMYALERLVRSLR